jgi:sulfite dehydrogenase
MITPNGVHFERSHSGIPDINPETHRLVIHGLVKRPLIFTLEALARYPMESRIAFIECGGNGQLLYQKEPAPVGVQAIHGLVSCAEWTGVKLSVLLQEAGVDRKARWILAEGADAAGMSRSVPLAKAMDDALIALYQNGERVRPSNGYPMRHLLPGYEGNMNVKWLRRIKLTEGPTMTKDETSKYTITLPDGKSLQFVLPQEGKSVITQPSPGLTHEGGRPLRNFRSCVVGRWQNHQCRGLGRRRQELGQGGVAAAGVVEGVDTLPHSVALERRLSAPAKPRHRRDRLRPADARENDRRARQPYDLSLQRNHDLGRV